MPSASDYVILRGGLAVPVAPILLLLDLESRGFLLERDGDNILIRQCAGQLTEADRTGLRHWKRHVLALLDFKAPDVA